MKQTVVDWMYQQLWEAPKDKFIWHSILEKYKEEEKEQMLNFYMWMRMNENAEKYLDYSDEDMFKEYLNQEK